MAAAASGEEKQLALSVAEYDRKYNIVASKIDQAIETLGEKGRWVAGYGSILERMPESAARDFKATLDTIKANLGFEELQSMRDSSPTGGALGQITEREIAFLQAIQGNLDTAQSPDQLRDVLVEIKEGRERFRQERMRIIAAGGSGSQGTPADFSGATMGDLLGADLSSMSEEQAANWNRRWEELSQ